MRLFRIAAAGFALALLSLPAFAQQTQLRTSQVTVGTGATQIATATPTRRAITLVQLGTVDTFIGAAGVATTTGVLLAGVKGTTLTIETTGAVFGIVGAGTQAVSVVETFQ